MPDTFSHLLYHIVFSTKDRLPLITRDIADDLYAYIGGILRHHNAVLIEIGGMPDHAHLLVRLRAQHSVAEIVKVVKSNSSRWMNNQVQNAKFAWQSGYGAFSVSESQAWAVVRYLRSQVEHHRRRSFREEFVTILERHSVEIDQRYLPP
ncbi:unnamed protein product [marine sediment metagenome]|uniref:Transposase IS200-like domain-containing protein n=1 Tax=marine sediment metagenome TaxID=412755 RepID=X0Y9Q4_9ZZZZ